MPAIVIDHRLCDVCGACVEMCAMQGLVIEQGRLVMVDASLCMVCKACESACHALAIMVYRDGQALPEFDGTTVVCYRA